MKKFRTLILAFIMVISKMMFFFLLISSIRFLNQCCFLFSRFFENLSFRLLKKMENDYFLNVILMQTMLRHHLQKEDNVFFIQRMLLDVSKILPEDFFVATVCNFLILDCCQFTISPFLAFSHHDSIPMYVHLQFISLESISFPFVI